MRVCFCKGYACCSQSVLAEAKDTPTAVNVCLLLQAMPAAQNICLPTAVNVCLLLQKETPVALTYLPLSVRRRSCPV